MLLVEWLSRQSKIKRYCNSDAGWILEIESNFNDEHAWKKDFIHEINNLRLDSESVEIIYSIHAYHNINDRFCLDGTLRQVETRQMGTISSSQLLSNDLMGQFTPFDFDVLTLTRDRNVEVLFTDDQLLQNVGDANRFKELDFQGLQFPVVGPINNMNGCFSVSVQSGMDGY